MFGTYSLNVSKSLQINLPEAALGPYAWEHRPIKRLRSNARADSVPNPPGRAYPNLPVETGQLDENLHHHSKKTSLSWDDTYLRYPDLKDLPRAQDVFRKIEADPCLVLRMPRPSVTAGNVLSHCTQCFEKILAENKPMSFKFGFTRDAAVRWHSRTYGYAFSKEKFDWMVVLYASASPHGPAFLEAALIEKYFGYLLAVECPTCLSL